MSPAPGRRIPLDQHRVPGRVHRGQRSYVGAKIPVELVERLDAARGEVSRTDYLWQLLATDLGLPDLGPASRPEHKPDPRKPRRSPALQPELDLDSADSQAQDGAETMPSKKQKTRKARAA